MTPNRKNNLTKADRRCGFFGRVIRFSVVLILSSCGGGLGGSGDGGGEGGNSSVVVPLPDGFEPGYEFNYIPERMLAQFPPSLAKDEAATDLADNSPFNRLTSTVASLIDSKLEIGLLQLHLEVNWPAIIAICATVPQDSSCDLTNAGISTVYTSAMASWEYLLRARLALERTGTTDTLAEETRSAIAQIVTAKIGTPVSLESGLVTVNSSGSYRYDFSITKDLGFGETDYLARWSENKALTFVSLSKVEPSVVDNLQSSTDNQNAANGFSNAILLTTFENGSRQERQLNLNQPANSNELRVQTQFTEFVESTKVDYYSIGNVGVMGGYLSSQQSSENDADMIISDLVRESFNQDAIIESQSICREALSEQQCDAEDRWELVTASDPIQSPFFLSRLQLDQLEQQVVPFDLRIEGISDELDALLLIRSEFVSVSISLDGIMVTLAGLGTFDFTDNFMIPELGFGQANPDTASFREYANSVLCRINKVRADGGSEYRSFCAGSSDEIEDALVVGEFFNSGELIMRWQVNADVFVRQD